MDDVTYDEKCEKILDILDILVNRMEAFETKLDGLEHMIVDDLFGGIESLYQDNVKQKGISEVKGKYGEMFDPFLPHLAETDPGIDIYDKLREAIDSIKGDEGYSEDYEREKVTGFHKSIEEKLREMGKLQPVAEVEITTESPESELTKKIKTMKESNKARGRDFTGL